MSTRRAGLLLTLALSSWLAALSACALAADTASLNGSKSLPRQAAGSDDGPTVTLVRSERFKAAGAYLVEGRARFRYRVTSRSDHWGRQALLVARVVCVDAVSGARASGPYSTTNWVWERSPAPGVQPGRDVVLKARVLLDASQRSTWTCSLRARSDFTATPPPEAGRPLLEAVGKRRGSPTFVRVQRVGRGSAMWADRRPNDYLRAGEAQFVLQRRFTADGGFSRLRMLADLELTTCYAGTASCGCARQPCTCAEKPCEDPRARSQPGVGSTVRSYLVATQLDAKGKPCPADGSQVTSPPQTVVIDPSVHHSKLRLELGVRRGTDARCGSSYAIKVYLKLLEGNPVKVHGKAYSAAFALIEG